MAVPAHDQRDYDFAKLYNLPIKAVIQAKSGEDTLDKEAMVGDGITFDSGEWSNLDVAAAKIKAIEVLEQKKVANRKVNYKLRDWIFSRQRYWGEPMPIVHCQVVALSR